MSCQRGCFNPHPARAGGVTGARRRVSWRDPGFNPHPARAGGVTCGLVFRLGRKAFLPLFRQPANPSCTKGFSVVKEQLQIVMPDTVMQRREIPVAEPPLGVRGTVLII